LKSAEKTLSPNLRLQIIVRFQGRDFRAAKDFQISFLAESGDFKGLSPKKFGFAFLPRRRPYGSGPNVNHSSHSDF